MSELRAAYETLRGGGTSHADAIDVLVTSMGIPRASVRVALERAGVFPPHSPSSRAAELAPRPASARERRSVSAKRSRYGNANRKG